MFLDNIENYPAIISRITAFIDNFYIVSETLMLRNHCFSIFKRGKFAILLKAVDSIVGVLLIKRFLGPLNYWHYFIGISHLGVNNSWLIFNPQSLGTNKRFDRFLFEISCRVSIDIDSNFHVEEQLDF